MRRAKTRRVMAHIGIIVLLAASPARNAARRHYTTLVAHPTYSPSGTGTAAQARSVAPSYECKTVLHAYMTDRELYTYYLQASLL